MVDQADQPEIEVIDFDEMIKRIIDPDTRVGTTENTEIWFELEKWCRVVRTRDLTPDKADAEGGENITDRELVAHLLNALIEDGESFTSSIVRGKETFKFNWAVADNNN